MEQKKISLKDLNKADVLAVLYNASKPQGMGFMHYDPKSMTREEAQSLLDAGQTDFDYLKGRVMKVDLSGNELSPWGYDRDNGEGAAERAISALRSTGKINPEQVQTVHRFRTNMEAQNVREELNRGNSSTEKGVIHLGLKDVAHVLGQKVNEAIKKLDDLK